MGMECCRTMLGATSTKLYDRGNQKARYGLTLLNRSSFSFCSTAARASVTLSVGAAGLSGVRAINGEGEAESTIESCARTRCSAGWSAERGGLVSTETELESAWF